MAIDCLLRLFGLAGEGWGGLGRGSPDRPPLPELLLCAMNATQAASAGTGGVPLSFLEERWTAMFEGRNHWVVMTMFLFVMHETVYFACWLPFLIADRIPALQKYKIQPVRRLLPGTRPSLNPSRRRRPWNPPSSRTTQTHGSCS